MYYYVVEEYRVSNELLTEDVFVSLLSSKDLESWNKAHKSRICKLRYSVSRVTSEHWKTKLPICRRRNSGIIDTREHKSCQYNREATQKLARRSQNAHINVLSNLSPWWYLLLNFRWIAEMFHGAKYSRQIIYFDLSNEWFICSNVQCLDAMTLVSRVSFRSGHMSNPSHESSIFFLVTMSKTIILNFPKLVSQLHKAGSGHSRQCWCILLLDKRHFGISSCSAFYLVAIHLSM